MSRLFFALWPDDETRDQLYQVATQFQDEPVRLVAKSNLHMTLAFLGEVSEHVQKEVTRDAASIKAKQFTLTLTRVGWWEKPRIAWLGPEQHPPQLLDLVEAIAVILKPHGIKPDKRRYKPHVTFARKVKQNIIAKNRFSIDWHINRFALIVSESGPGGVTYRVLKSWLFS
ncbi:MAG: RNA 2',3'-cyclic phosphodiesterase [Gammaproteobacteria bacterium]